MSRDRRQRLLQMGGAFRLSSIGSLILDLNPDTLVENDGDVVASFLDSVAWHDFAQSDNGKRPLLKKGANGINGHNVVLFDGIDDLLVYAGSLSAATAGTVFIVYRFTAAMAGGTQEILGSADVASANYYWAIRISKSGALPFFEFLQKNNDTDDTVRGSTSQVAGTTDIGCWRSTGTEYLASINGSTETLTVITGGNTGDWLGDTPNRDNITLGALKFISEAERFKGAVARVLMFSENLSEANLSAVTKYLNQLYAP